MRLNQVTIPCRNYAESVAFYKTLGLQLIVDSPPRYARFECPAESSEEIPATLSLHQDETHVAGDYPMIYFEVDDVKAVVEQLRCKGLVVSEARAESWLWTEARLSDPSGNPVCIYHAGRNRRFPPWRVNVPAND